MVLVVSEEEGEEERGRAVCILGGDRVKVACDSRLLTSHCSPLGVRSSSV